MSNRLLARLKADDGVDLTELSSGARFILAWYCEHADDRTFIAYPGTPRLARLTGLSDRQVQRYVQELRGKGFLRIYENRGGAHRYASYLVCVGIEPTLDPVAQEQLRAMGYGSGPGTGV